MSIVILGAVAVVLLHCMSAPNKLQSWSRGMYNHTTVPYICKACKQ